MATPHPDSLVTTLGTLHAGGLTIVSESESLGVVARIFLDAATSCVVLDEPPLRVVTERDLVGAWAQGRSVHDQIGSVATVNPYWAPVTASVSEAAALMVRLGIRHLVVVDIAGRPIGVVSMAELFSVLVHSQEHMALYAGFVDLMVHGETRVGGHLLGVRE